MQKQCEQFAKKLRKNANKCTNESFVSKARVQYANSKCKMNPPYKKMQTKVAKKTTTKTQKPKTNRPQSLPGTHSHKLEVDPEDTKLLLRSWIILSLIMQASVVCRFQVSNICGIRHLLGWQSRELMSLTHPEVLLSTADWVIH